MKKLLFIFIFFSTIVVSAQTYDQNLPYGSGVNTVGRVVKYSEKSVIEFTLPKLDTAFSSANVVIKAKIITKKEDIYDALNMNIETALSFKFFGASSKISSQYSKINTFEVNNYSEYLLVYCDITYPQKSPWITNLKLTDEAKRVAKRNPENFIPYYGDAFVVKKVYGGKLAIIYSFKSSTEESKKKSSIAIKAIANYFNNEASLKYSTSELNNLLKESEAKDVLFVQYGSSVTPTSYDLETLKEYLINFPQELRKNPLFVSSTVQKYTDVFGKDLKKVSYTDTEIKFKIEDANSIIEFNTVQLNSAKYVFNHQSEFNLEEVKNYMEDKGISYLDDNKSGLENLKKYIENCNTKQLELERSVKKILLGEMHYDELDPEDSKVIEFTPPALSKEFVRDNRIEIFDINLTENKFGRAYKRMIIHSKNPINMNVGYCDWFLEKYISIQGKLQVVYTNNLNNKLSVTNAFIVIFKDKEGNEMHRENYRGKPVKWIPGTEAFIQFTPPPPPHNNYFYNSSHSNQLKFIAKGLKVITF